MAAEYRSRREYDDDDDEDRPRRRYRDEYDDEDDRPRKRRRRKSSAGKIILIVGGGLAVVALLVVVVFLVGGGADISYEKYSAITTTDSIETLKKKFGRPTKYERSEWRNVTIGQERQGNSTLADYAQFAENQNVTLWYGWKSGKEELYVAEGTDEKGRPALILKIYLNPKVVRDAVQNPGNKANKGIPWFEVASIKNGVLWRMGGG